MSATSTVRLQATRSKVISSLLRMAWRGCPAALGASVGSTFYERGGRSDEVRVGRPGGGSRRSDQAGCGAGGGRGAGNRRGRVAPWQRGDGVGVWKVPRGRAR